LDEPYRPNAIACHEQELALLRYNPRIGWGKHSHRERRQFVNSGRDHLHVPMKAA
jgi:hypothetical protein